MEVTDVLSDRMQAPAGLDRMVAVSNDGANGVKA